MRLSELIKLAQLETQKDVEMFHALRTVAFGEAERIYKEREPSYNADHEPTEEMVYGPMSLASEIFKRIRRMTSILSPSKDDLSDTDLDRLADTCVDTINYSSWMWALLKIARSKSSTEDIEKTFMEAIRKDDGAR
jgi:hypothetical protein